MRHFTTSLRKSLWSYFCSLLSNAVFHFFIKTKPNSKQIFLCTNFSQ